MTKVAKVPFEQKIDFMIETVREQYEHNRKDSDFLKRSKQAKANRLSGQTEETFDPSHCQGNISTTEVVAQMASRSNGVLPTAADFYEKTHSVNVGEGETDLIGERANKIMEEYNEKLENYKEKGIEKDPNDLYLEIVGGLKKGKVYDLWSASQMYNKQHPSSYPTASFSTPFMISQLSSQVEELKRWQRKVKKWRWKA